MVRRNDKVAFMAGSYVFPGRPRRRKRSPRGERCRPAIFGDLSDAEEAAYRTAAVRELQEEANVIITVDDLVPVRALGDARDRDRRYDTRFFVARMPAGQTPHTTRAKPRRSSGSRRRKRSRDSSGRSTAAAADVDHDSPARARTSIDDAIAWARARRSSA